MVKKKTPAKTKRVPTGVKAISILYYVGAVLMVLLAILFIVGAGAVSTLLEQYPILSALGSGVLILVGIIMIALAVLYFFVAKGLTELKSWARILVIVFSVIGFLSALSTLFSGDVAGSIFSLVINGVIGYYLWFGKEPKKAFS